VTGRGLNHETQKRLRKENRERGKEEESSLRHLLENESRFLPSVICGKKRNPSRLRQKGSERGGRGRTFTKKRRLKKENRDEEGRGNYHRPTIKGAKGGSIRRGGGRRKLFGGKKKKEREGPSSCGV